MRVGFGPKLGVAVVVIPPVVVNGAVEDVVAAAEIEGNQVAVYEIVVHGSPSPTVVVTTLPLSTTTMIPSTSVTVPGVVLPAGSQVEGTSGDAGEGG